MPRPIAPSSMQRSEAVDAILTSHRTTLALHVVLACLAVAFAILARLA